MKILSCELDMGDLWLIKLTSGDLVMGRIEKVQYEDDWILAANSLWIDRPRTIRTITLPDGSMRTILMTGLTGDKIRVACSEIVYYTPESYMDLLTVNAYIQSVSGILPPVPVVDTPKISVS